MSIGKNMTPLQAVKAIQQLDTEKLPKNLGSSAVNKIVITDSEGNIITGSINVSDIKTYTLTKNESNLIFSDDEGTSTSISISEITEAERTKLQNIESNAQVNKIETIKVNNEVQTISDKTINISIPEAPVYSIVESDTSAGYAKSYSLTKDGTETGVKINIPKDLVISSGSVQTVSSADIPYTGAAVGDKYLDIVLNDSTQNHIYIPVKDLVDVYTSGNGISIDTNNQVSAVIDTSSSNGLSVDNKGIKLALATSESSGAMSSSDKAKLDGYPGIEQLLSSIVLYASIDIGDGVNSQFTYTADKIITGEESTNKFVYFIQSVLLFDKNTGEQVFADIIIDLGNSSKSDGLTIKFSNVPTSNQYECRITYSMKPMLL